MSANWRQERTDSFLRDLSVHLADPLALSGV
jgi:hypothetical protein